MLELTSREKNLALVTAVAERNAGQVDFWLGKGADIHYDNESPLRSAIYMGYPDIAERLLEKGADVHVNGEEPLYISLQARDMDMANVLLKHGASVDSLLKNKKLPLDKQSLAMVDEIKSRAAREAFQKHASSLREKAQQKKPSFKPRPPAP